MSINKTTIDDSDFVVTGPNGERIVMTMTGYVDVDADTVEANYEADFTAQEGQTGNWGFKFEGPVLDDEGAPITPNQVPFAFDLNVPAAPPNNNAPIIQSINATYRGAPLAANGQITTAGSGKLIFKVRYYDQPTA